jgi:hypothetical protein
MTQMPESRPQTEPAVIHLPELTTSHFSRDPLVLLIVLVTFALYLFSMPKTVALEDDRIFFLPVISTGPHIHPATRSTRLSSTGLGKFQSGTFRPEPMPAARFSAHSVVAACFVFSA